MLLPKVNLSQAVVTQICYEGCITVLLVLLTLLGLMHLKSHRLCLSLHGTVLTKLCCIKTIIIQVLCIVTYSFISCG